MLTLSGDSSKIRRINRELLLGALRDCADASLSELSRVTGLSLATCSNILPELLAAGAVIELDERESRGGRPARRFRHNPEYILIAAVMARLERRREILAFTVVDSAGRVVEEGEVSHGAVGLSEVDELAGDLVAKHPRIRALSFSVPGVVREGVIGISDLPCLAGQAVEERIRTRHGVAAAVENDMNFAAMGYWRSLAGRNVSGLAYMVFPSDSCAGSGLVVNGTLVKGMSNFAGEISFIPFGEDRARQLERLGDRGWRIRFVGRTVAAVAAVVNPDVVVLSGDAVSDDMLDDIRKRCLSTIPAEHLPDLVVKPDYRDDCRAGMIAVALDGLGCGMRLVKKERIWCANG